MKMKKEDKEKKIQIKIEDIKSFFVLSQILIILAGFAFTSSGVLYSNAQMVSIQSSISGNNFIYNFEFNNQSIPDYIYGEYKDFFGKKTISLISYSKQTLLLGIMLTILSMVFWIIGKNKLKGFS